MSGTWEGRDRIVDGFFATAMTNDEPGSVELEVTAMIAEEDQVVMQWTSRARTRDGRPYENGCIGVFTLRDSANASVREYMDTALCRDRIRAARPCRLTGGSARGCVRGPSDAAREGRRSRAAPRTQSRCRRQCPGGGAQRSG